MGRLGVAETQSGDTAGFRTNVRVRRTIPTRDEGCLSRVVAPFKSPMGREVTKTCFHTGDLETADKL